MVYCAKCGKQNDDDAVFCKNCGTSLTGGKPGVDQRAEKRCEEECSGGQSSRGWGTFWGVIIILIGVTIIFEFVLKGMAKDYSWLSWVNSLQWSWIFAFVIAIFIIIFGVRIVTKR